MAEVLGWMRLLRRWAKSNQPASKAEPEGMETRGEKEESAKGAERQ